MSEERIHPTFQTWRSGASKSSSNMRSAQSISEGNFKSCYANNKAENFKFRRVSQGIESCAQAHLLKYRKEKGKLKGLLDILEKEKRIHKTQRASSHSVSSSDNDTFHCPNCLNTYAADSFENETPVSCSSPANVDKDEYEAEDKGETKGKKDRTHSNSKGKKSLRRLTEFKEVTPFYLQHNYAHYHYDPRYDDSESSQSNSTKAITASDKPSWTKESNPLILWEARRRKSSHIENESVKKFSSSFLAGTASSGDLSDNLHQITFNNGGVLASLNVESVSKFPQIVNTSSTEGVCGISSDSETDFHPISQTHMEKFCKTCIQHLGLDVANNATVSSLPDVSTGPESKQSFLTLSERQQLSQYNKGRKSLIESDKIAKVTKETKLQQSHSYHNPAKVELLKKIANTRLSKGESIRNLAEESIFSDVLEICDDGQPFPAYEPGTDLTFENYRALRKCKYLRMSKSNIESLKEATISYLGGL